MTTPIAKPRPVEPMLDPRFSARWTEWVEERFGTAFSEQRRHILDNCIRERLSATRWSEDDYFRLVAGAAAPTAETEALMEKVLNHETSFFRHQPSFDTLAGSILPELRRFRPRNPETQRNLRLWSAGSSTGEEAYSMAIVGMEQLLAGACTFEVWGTDFSRQCVESGRQGLYSRRAVDPVPPALRDRYFRPKGADRFEVVSFLRDRTRFELFNFVEPSSFPEGRFDVVFCQNVLIYFRDPLRRAVAASLVEKLAPGGFLVTAPGELPPVGLSGAEPVWFGPTLVYRKGF